MRINADAVIIGGGIIGVATAFYLAREKYGNIVLLEKETFLGSGSTSKAAGGIRAQFATRTNIQMSMLSEKIFANFKEETGFDALYTQCGYMFLLSEDKDIDEFKKSYQLQKSLGLPVELLKPDDIKKYAPIVRTDDIKLATFCRDDGIGDPSEFLAGYEKAARKLGVEINIETEVTGFNTREDKITGVKTNKGEIKCPLVINCTGAWTKLIGRMVGVNVRVEPVRRQCVTTGELDFINPEFPMVVDVKSGLYTHRESKGLLLGWADKNVKPSFDISIDPDYTDNILERALDRIPRLETAEIANQWAGLYETTPDHRAIIGWEKAVAGLFHITGFSGHGFMHAPAAGLVTTDILTGREPRIDISDLEPQRFAEGVVTEETNVI
ncbi:MAG: FAD-binding oxidoreductase [candidate division Zixibacteria bacterium]|nr:FAD-binding oxidoreductase [candidate division Zixibacteria bacterium]MDD5425058.1 FAD-binding oxidoreductase [candidate division Zixibacteria bacterium]